MISRIPIFPGDTIQLMSRPMSGSHFNECMLVKSVRRVGDIFNDSLWNVHRYWYVRARTRHGHFCFG